MLFAALIVGMVSAGGEATPKSFAEAIAAGPYREGSDHVHTEPGDLPNGPAISNIAVIPNVPAGPVDNEAFASDSSPQQAIRTSSG